MSGIKETYVTMTTTERNRMLQQCRTAQDNEATERQRRMQLETANRDAQARISALDSRLNSQIPRLANEMREIERRQNETFRNALAKQGGDFRREIQQHRRELAQEMQQQKQELSQMIGNIAQEIKAKDLKEEQLAGFWVTQAQAYLAEIDNYRHELFCPTRLQMLRTELGQIQGTKINAAVISTAINVFNRAVVLRSDVVSAEIEWSASFERLSQDIAELGAAVNAAKLLDFQIGEETVQARVDYWTNGALSELDRRVSEIRSILKEPNGVSNDTLVSLISETDNLTRHLSEPNTGLIDTAKESLMLSASREDMANDVVNALTGMGWELEDYTYRNSEQKEALHAKIVDRTGNECVVIIEPHDNHGKLENKLRLDFFNDSAIDTSGTEMYISSIKQELQHNGVKLDLRCAEGYANRFSDRNEIRNIEQARGQTAST